MRKENKKIKLNQTQDFNLVRVILNQMSNFNRNLSCCISDSQTIRFIVYSHVI